MLRDLKELLYTAAYYPKEIERILDPKHPSFIKFDPDLGYELKDYIFSDGMEGTFSDYTYEPHGGHRLMVHYRNQPCRINTYGDSYTQCAQVSNCETWQEVLAAHFREPIRNFGVGGYGVYQAYLRALRTEKTDLAAEYIVLNIWDDDYYRNLDAARWIRVGWMCRDLPRGGGEETYPVHGFPWGHVRFDVSKGEFVEEPGALRKAEDLRKLVGKEPFYEFFKDDHVAHLYALREGGEAPTAKLEEIAEAFGLKVNLRDPKKRARDAMKLHTTYAMRSTMFIVDKLADWAQKEKRKLLILLSYDVPTVRGYIKRRERFDKEFVDYLKKKKLLYVDCLQKAADEFKVYKLSIEGFLGRFYVSRAGAQVYGHYNPYGNFWFAYAIRKEILDWLDPKPPAYR